MSEDEDAGQTGQDKVVPIESARAARAGRPGKSPLKGQGRAEAAKAGEAQALLSPEFAARVFHKLRPARFIHERNKWVCWSAAIKNWDPDRAQDQVYLTLRDALVAFPATTPSMLTGKYLDTLVGLLTREPLLSTRDAEWDARPGTLAAGGRLIDLETGHERDLEPDDYCLTMASFAPAPAGTPAPAWEKFLDEAFDGNLDMLDYLQRLLGATLWGDPKREQMMIVLLGEGGSGKSTLVHAISNALGSYAGSVPKGLLAANDQDHPTKYMAVRGLRLATMSEASTRRQWDSERVKALTGGDDITGRWMHGNFVTFKATHTLMLATNEMPTLEGADSAVGRRPRIVTMNNPPTQADPDLFEHLKDEAPQILRWLLEGAAAYRMFGLSAPDDAQESVREYMADADPFGAWFASEVEVTGQPTDWTSRDALHSAARAFELRNHQSTKLSDNRLGQRIRQALVRRHGADSSLRVAERRARQDGSSNPLRGYEGVRLRSPDKTVSSTGPF